MSDSSPYFAVEFELPGPLRVASGGLEILLGDSVVPTTVHLRDGGDGLATVAEVTIRPTVRAVWCRWSEDHVASHLIHLGTDPEGPALPLVDRAVMTLLDVLSFAALEAAAPHVVTEFTRDVQRRVRSVSGVDSEGEAFEGPVEPDMMMSFMEGVFETQPATDYRFGRGLTVDAFEHIGLAKKGEPHWDYWRIGYHAALCAGLSYGDRSGKRRECVTSLQTAMECAMIAVCQWPETAQYGPDTIGDLPQGFRPDLKSLLLTRNLMLHRGRILRKFVRANESWKEARLRSSQDADGELTAAHLLEFARVTFEALRWLEGAPPDQRPKPPK